MSFLYLPTQPTLNIYVEIKNIFSNSCIYLSGIYLQQGDLEVKVTDLSIFPSPFCQHELLQPGEHGEDPAGVGQPVVGQGLHQAGVHHTEGVGEALQCLHCILVCQVIAGKYDPNVFFPVYPESAPENVNGSRSLETLFETQFKIPRKT